MTAQPKPAPVARAMTFAMIVTHQDADQAREVCQAFAKLSIFIADSLGARATRTEPVPWRNGGVRVWGWRCNVSVIGSNERTAVELTELTRRQLHAAANDPDANRGCNFTFGQALLTSVAFAEELAARNN